MSSDIRKRLEKIYVKINKLAVKGKDRAVDYYALVDEFIDRGDFDDFTQTLYYYYEVDVTKYRDNIFDIKRRTWKDIQFQTTSNVQRKLKKLFDSNNLYQQGYDVYGDGINTISFNVSSPLSVTYSVTSSTQSISINRTGQQIYFTTNDSQIYSMELWKCQWSVINGLEQPVPKTLELFQRFNVYATQSTYLTELSVFHGRQYLIKTSARNTNIQFTSLNYKLDVDKNILLGQIKEVDVIIDDQRYLQKNNFISKYDGSLKTYLEVIKGTFSIYVTYENPQLSEEQNLIKRYEAAISYLIS